MHRTLFTTNYTTSCNQGHFNLKAFSIEIHNNIQAPFVAQQQESHNCSCVPGRPGAAGTGPRDDAHTRALSPATEPPSKPAQPECLNLFTFIADLNMTRTSPNLPFPPASVTAGPFLRGSFGWTRALLRSLCFKSSGLRRSSGHSFFMDLVHGVTCAHAARTGSPGGFGARHRRQDKPDPAWPGKFGWGSSFCASRAVTSAGERVSRGTPRGRCRKAAGEGRRVGRGML